LELDIPKSVTQKADDFENHCLFFDLKQRANILVLKKKKQVDFCLSTNAKLLKILRGFA